MIEYQHFEIPNETVDVGHDGQWLLTLQEGRPVGITNSCQALKSNSTGFSFSPISFHRFSFSFALRETAADSELREVAGGSGAQDGADTWIGRTLSVVLGLYGLVVVAVITSIFVNFYNETAGRNDKKEIKHIKKQEDEDK